MNLTAKIAFFIGSCRNSSKEKGALVEISFPVHEKGNRFAYHLTRNIKNTSDIMKATMKIFGWMVGMLVMATASVSAQKTLVKGVVIDSLT